MFPERSQIGFQNVLLHDGYLHFGRKKFIATLSGRPEGFVASGALVTGCTVNSLLTPASVAA